MSYENIFYENELKYRISNRKILNGFINSFCIETGLNIEWIRLIYGKKCEDVLWLFNSLKDYIFRIYPELIDPFYHLLKEYSFIMYHDVFSWMCALGYFISDPIKNENTGYALLSPNINNVSYNQEKITIYSKDYGNYSFCNLQEYYSNNSKIISYISNENNKQDEKFMGNCHNRSWNLLNILKEGSLITFLMPYYFEGTLYHSVVRDKFGNIIDCANEIVYDNSIMNELLNSQIVSETNYEDLGEQLYNAKRESGDLTINFSKPLLLALHKQMKERKNG